MAERWIATAGGRLVDVAKEHLGAFAVDAIGPLIAAGGITVNGAAGAIAQPVRAGDVLALVHAVAAAAIADATLGGDEVAVRYEDADAIVVDKPAGMHVHPVGAHRGGTLLGALAVRAGAGPGGWWTAWRPHPAHRLDRCASGLVLFAKHAAAHARLRAAFAAGQVARTYRARVVGHVVAAEGVIDAPLARDPVHDYRRAVVATGQPAVTRYRVVAHRADGTTDLELALETGRTHQIRAHLASIGHPIAGDALYAATPPGPPAAAIALHATRLVVAATPIACESAAPPW